MCVVHEHLFLSVSAFFFALSLSAQHIAVLKIHLEAENELADGRWATTNKKKE